ncbi:MAG: T9SS type A sorting domain-containing protein [Crocinitomix sp.]|nr:T9SS type A sorting domain-containing protein [Crocinitomix sp.]
MKKILYSIVFICASSSLFAQDFIYNYLSLTTGSTSIFIRDVIKTNDNHLVAAFDLEGFTDLGGPMGGIMKLEADGKPIWTKLFNVPGSAANCAFEVVENNAGNYVMWGLNKNLADGRMEAILFEVTPNAEVLWSKKYDFDDEEGYYTINRMMILPSGELEMMISIYEKLIILRTTAEGEIIWGKSSFLAGPGGSPGKNPGFDLVSLPGDGGICANKFGSDFALIRYGEDGETNWTKRYSIGLYMHAKSILQMPSGNFAVGGFVIDSVTTKSSVLIMSVSDVDGSILWIKTLNEHEIGYNSNLRLSHLDGDCVATFSPGSGSLNYQHYLRFDVDGNIVSSAKSRTHCADINRLEVIDTDEVYAYGSGRVDTDPTNRKIGMIQRTSDLFAENCRNELITITTTNYTEYEELESESVLTDFTEMEVASISLIDLEVRLMDYCTEQFFEIGDDNPFEEVQHEDPVDASGIEEIENGILIYPNPSSNLVNIKVNADLINASYKLNSLAGQTVLSGFISGEQLRIDVSNLENGQYILSIRNKTEIKTKKITVLK